MTRNGHQTYGLKASKKSMDQLSGLGGIVSSVRVHTCQPPFSHYIGRTKSGRTGKEDECKWKLSS